MNEERRELFCKCAKLFWQYSNPFRRPPDPPPPRSKDPLVCESSVKVRYTNYLMSTRVTFIELATRFAAFEPPLRRSFSFTRGRPCYSKVMQVWLQWLISLIRCTTGQPTRCAQRLTLLERYTHHSKQRYTAEHTTSLSPLLYYSDKYFVNWNLLKRIISAVY